MRTMLYESQQGGAVWYSHCKTTSDVDVDVDDDDDDDEQQQQQRNYLQGNFAE